MRARVSAASPSGSWKLVRPRRPQATPQAPMAVSKSVKASVVMMAIIASVPAGALPGNCAPILDLPRPFRDFATDIAARQAQIGEQVLVQPGQRVPLPLPFAPCQQPRAGACEKPCGYNGVARPCLAESDILIQALRS